MDFVMDIDTAEIVQDIKEPYSIKRDDNEREKISRLQDSMIDVSEGDELDKFPLNHYFAPGAYAREMFLPKDHVIVGKIHKHAHLNIISYGHVVVATEEGNKELKGPLTFTSPAGVKRAVTILEDTLWTTIHLTEETDLDKIEEDVIAPSFTAFDKYEEQKKLEDTI